MSTTQPSTSAQPSQLISLASTAGLASQNLGTAAKPAAITRQENTSALSGLTAVPGLLASL